MVHVGAGLSTSAGIPDFRGKSGVWTKLLRNNNDHDPTCRRTSSEKIEDISIKSEECGGQSGIKPFDETIPTKSHLILRELCTKNLVGHIVSQNVDGLFLKANFPRRYISELHGDFYLDECTCCRSRFIRGSASQTMRLTRSLVKCPRDDKVCRGHLRDTILDWESPIPYNELRTAERESKRSKLHICIGTSMQLRPSKDLVCNRKKNKACKLVVINLQPTQFDKLADMVINYYADEVMTLLAKQLDLNIPDYNPGEDPTKRHELIGTPWRKM